MKTRSACLWLLMICALAVPLAAKGPTTRIVITGPTLPAPIEITDAAVLRDFVVWSGAGTRVNGVEQSKGFIIDWLDDSPDDRPAGLPRYDVSFYVKYANRPLDSQEEVLAYVVSYEPNQMGKSGYVYLPGSDDGRYALNAKTMLRGCEGHWFHASETWDRVAADLIASRLK